jgi:hypothetical protein
VSITVYEYQTTWQSECKYSISRSSSSLVTSRHVPSAFDRTIRLNREHHSIDISFQCSCRENEVHRPTSLKNSHQRNADASSVPPSVSYRAARGPPADRRRSRSSLPPVTRCVSIRTYKSHFRLANALAFLRVMGALLEMSILHFTFTSLLNDIPPEFSSKRRPATRPCFLPLDDASLHNGDGGGKKIVRFFTVVVHLGTRSEYRL